MNEIELPALAFPKLTESQMTGIGQCELIVAESYTKGAALFEVGDCTRRFFIIKTGEVEIIEGARGSTRTITILRSGQFTGEVPTLIGGPTLVRAVAREAAEVYSVSSHALQEILNHHPDLGDVFLQAFLTRRHALREPGQFTGIRVIGSRGSQATFRVRDFLSKNRVPFAWLDLDDDAQVKQLLDQFRLTEADTPVVAWDQRVVLRNPSIRQVAETLGMSRDLETKIYDLAVVGAGPAGLAAAVYGASEGLSTIVLERTAPGGQAGRSMRIENYLGFPGGITGDDLAERAVVQANRFGASLPVATDVLQLRFDGPYKVLQVDGGEQVRARCLLIATGADYRHLPAEGCEQFEGRGVYYAATSMEARMCSGATVIVVGGGNSAGQAAVFLSNHAEQVYLVIRGDDLYKNMSSYLATRVEQTSNIEILFNTEILRMSGERHLAEVEIANSETKEVRPLRTTAVFSFIGAVPRTEWLPPEIQKDSRDFVLTGLEVASSPHWSRNRPPFLLETSRAGVFAAGDVRSGSVKRVASAVGEGSMAVQFIHEALRDV